MSMGQTRPVPCRSAKCKGTQTLLGSIRKKIRGAYREVALIFGCTSCGAREETPQS